MNLSIEIANRPPSALSRLLKRTIGAPSPSRPNFVRPLAQPLDPEFPCPCCDEVLTIPASQAGKKSRCRHCYSPIRNANPTLEKPARDLSQDFDPIARPRDYPLSGHRATIADYIPRSAIAALPLLFLVATGITLIALLPKGNIRTGAIAAAAGPTPIEVLTSPALEAEQLVSSFLSASDWTESVTHVHSGLGVAGEIAALNEHLPEGGFKTSSRLNKDGTSTVRVNFQDGTLAHFQVANIEGEDLILWDANPSGLPNELNSRMVGLPGEEPN